MDDAGGRSYAGVDEQGGVVEMEGSGYGGAIGEQGKQEQREGITGRDIIKCGKKGGLRRACAGDPANLG